MSTSKEHFFSLLALWRGRFASLSLLLVASCPVPAGAETWTNLRGTHSVEAEMIGLWGDSVILEMSGGKRVTVKMSDLRSESRIQAQNLSKEIASSRADRVNELLENAAAAAAAAPDPLPKPPAAPAYQAPQKDAKVIDFLSQIEEAVADGHILAIYDALPPSYRKDIDDLVLLGAQRMNANSWQGLVGTAHRLSDLIVTRQNWFRSSPRIQALPPEKYDLVDGQILLMAGLLRVGLSPEAADLNQLQSMSFREWLAERDEAIAPFLAGLVEQMDIGLQRQITVTAENGDAAAITIGQDGASRPMELVNVEGYWVPKNIAVPWAENVAGWKADIANSTSQIDTLGSVLGALSPALDPLAQAQNAADFHAAMEGLFSPSVETAIATIATALGKGTSLANNNQNSRGGGFNQGYNQMDMDMEDEMSMSAGGPPQGFGSGSGPPQGFGRGSGPPQGFGTGSGPPQGYGSGSGPPQGGPPQGFGAGSGPPQGYGSGSGPPQGGPPQGFGSGSGPPQGFGSGSGPPQGYGSGSGPPQGIGAGGGLPQRGGGPMRGGSLGPSGGSR